MSTEARGCNGAVFRARALPSDPGPSGWNALLPEAPAATPLQGRVRADWLVVGAGFAGLSAARRLAQRRPGEPVVVLDACRIGEGPAGRNSGFIIDLPHDVTSEDYGGDPQRDRLQTRMNRAAIEFACDAAREYAMPAEALAPVGKVNAAAGPKGMRLNRAYAAHLSALGEAHRLMDAGEMRALTGTDYYLGGLFTPGTVMIQPAMYVRALAAGLPPPVTVHENSPVTALRPAGEGWLATTPGGSVAAGRVILAVNGHVQSFGFFPGRLMHVFTYASMTRPLTPDEVRRLGGRAVWAVTPSDPLGTTVRRVSGTGGDRIVVRNGVTFAPDMRVASGDLSGVWRLHDRSFARRFPMLDGVEMAYRWGGRLCLSRNGVAAFGEVEPGLYSACCQNGLGAARGTLQGMLAADLATGNDGEMVAAMLAEAEPQKLPPAPLASLGARAVLRWGRFRAGAEL